MNKEKITQTIRNKGLVILRTDTLYGIIASVLHPEAIERIYAVKNRDRNKSMIVLAANLEQIQTITGPLGDNLKNQLHSYWPGSYSIILPLTEAATIEYIHRGTKDIAFRIPDNIRLQKLLQQTGPVVAPSANPEGSAPAKNIPEARAYFGDAIDMYVDDGIVTHNQPSKLIRILPDGTTKQLR